MATLKYWDTGTSTWKAVGGGDGGGASTAADVTVTPTGTIVATDVQAAIAELSSEIVTEGLTRLGGDNALDTRVDALEAGGGITLSTMRGAVSCLAWNDNTALTIANDATRQSVWSGTADPIPAATLVAGDTIDLLATFAVLNNTGTAGDVDFEITLGGTIVASVGTGGTPGNLLVSNVLTRGVRLWTTIACQTAGPTGTIFTSTSLQVSDTAEVGASGVYYGGKSRTTYPIATTAALPIGITTKMDAASANFTVGGRGIRLNRHNVP